MPLITGIVALSLVCSATDDPLLDRQFAFVKKDQTKICAQDPIGAVQEKPVVVPVLVDLPITLTTATQAAATARVDEARFTEYSPFGVSNLMQIPALQRTVSINMENRSAADVLKWLAKQGVSYVVNVDSLPKSKVSINMIDAALHEVLSGLGDVLGGHWNVRGKTLIFMPGNSHGFTGSRLQGFTGGRSHGFPGVEVPAMRFEADVASKWMAAKQGQIAKELKVTAEKAATADKIMKRGQEMVKEYRVDVRKFLDSMTPKQKDLMKSQGHLHVSDLSQDQIKMLRIDLSESKKGDFFMTMSLDGDKVVIKSNSK